MTVKFVTLATCSEIGSLVEAALISFIPFQAVARMGYGWATDGPVAKLFTCRMLFNRFLGWATDGPVDKVFHMSRICHFYGNPTVRLTVKLTPSSDSDF